MSSNQQAKVSRLVIERELWQRLILDIRERGANVRESGAFLLGKPNQNEVTHYVCYDELDENALETGMIIFDSVGFVNLIKYCHTHGLVVLADVHTHPKNRTLQSEFDRTNPMIGIKGHIALILPNFATGNLENLDGVGIYEYVSQLKWKTWTNQKHIISLK